MCQLVAEIPTTVFYNDVTLGFHDADTEHDTLGWLSIDAVLSRTAGLKNGVRFPRTIL